MKRLVVPARADWKQKVESQGLTFHTRDAAYWNESAAYAFRSHEIDTLEKAANDVHELCLEAAQHIVDKNRFEDLGLPPKIADIITSSWNANELHLYGRFDFAYDGLSAPKMLEYNADTPTSLLEASAVQWYWLEDHFAGKDQFNSLHDNLIARWKELKLVQPIHFTTLRDVEEDRMTIAYLEDTARQAGLKTSYLDMEDIGHDSKRKSFVDLEGKTMDSVFKLYPWEWMIGEEFGQYIPDAKTRWIEPAWKMLWSNKGILPILYELFPNHPNLLPSYTSQDKIPGRWVKKPLLSREGANVTINDYGKEQTTDGAYGDGAFIYQEYQPIATFDGKTPVLGLWMIGDECGGMGIRESDGPITGNLSRFTPHIIE